MAVPKQIKLPRNYYRKRTVPPAFRPPNKVFNTKFEADFGSIGPGRNRAIRTMRSVLLQDLATSIVNQTRAVHINVTNGMWRTLVSQGHLNEDVAIIVDGSPQRPMKNVSFGGTIDIVAPPSVEQMIEAAEFAWGYMLALAAKTKGPFSGDARKKGAAGSGYRYHQDFVMFVSGQRVVTSPADLRKPGVFGPTDFIQIQNVAPYAAKLERYRYPHGVFNSTWKKLRSKYRTMAIRFDYVENTTGGTLTGTGGVAIPQPVIMIGQPGAFPSRKPNLQKFVRDRPESPGQRAKFGQRKWRGNRR